MPHQRKGAYRDGLRFLVRQLTIVQQNTKQSRDDFTAVLSWYCNRTILLLPFPAEP